MEELRERRWHQWEGGHTHVPTQQELRNRHKHCPRGGSSPSSMPGPQKPWWDRAISSIFGTKLGASGFVPHCQRGHLSQCHPVPLQGGNCIHWVLVSTSTPAPYVCWWSCWSPGIGNGDEAQPRAPPPPQGWVLAVALRPFALAKSIIDWDLTGFPTPVINHLSSVQKETRKFQK